MASILWCIFTVAMSLGAAANEPSQHDSEQVTIVVNRINRVSPNEVHFQLSLRNATASPVFLEGRALGFFPEQLYLEQWKDGRWHLIAPCLENAPSSVLRLNPGRAVNQDRVLTDPVEAPCKDRHVQLQGKFRFRLEYFLSEQDAKENERNFDASGANLPAPQVVVSASFEIPLK
jgi:hypothetical protein